MRVAFHTAYLFDDQPWDDGHGFIGVLTHDGPSIASRHILNGGKGGSGQSNQNSMTTMTIPPEVMARYNAVNARAEQTADRPFQEYGGQFVAPVNDTQGSAINQITGARNWIDPTFARANGALNTAVNSAQPGLASAQGWGDMNQTALNTAQQGAGQAQPYNMGATGLAMAGTQSVDPQNLQGQIGQYMNPYNEAVVQSTLGNLQQQQAMDRQDLIGNSILSGSYGGDRTGIAMANLQRQQGLATGQVASNLYNQNYQQALGTAQQQQGVNLGAEQANRAALQQGAGQIAGIGQQVYGQGLGLGQFQGQMGQQGYGQGLGLAQANYGIGSNAAQLYNQFGTQALQNDLSQSQAQLGAGTVAQQTQQADLSAQYNQFLQQQGYPFQTAQFLANIAMGTGAQSGSQSATTSGAFQPQPYFSDKDLKHEIKVLGHTKDGIPIVRFKYKGQGETHIGFLAQDVEKVRPEAVGESHGYKTVDYERATKAFGGLATADGGSVSVDNAHQGFAAGGIPGLPNMGGNPVASPPMPVPLPGTGLGSAPFDPLKPVDPLAKGETPKPGIGLSTGPVGLANMMDAGSANAATGNDSGTAGNAGDGTSGGVSGSGGVGGSASSDAGVGGSAAAGVGGDDGGTYWAGGRAHRAGGGGLGTMGDILALQKSLYETMPGQKGREVAGSSGGLGTKPATGRPLQMATAASQAPAASGSSGLSRDVNTIGSVASALKSGKELYKSGKDAYDWISDKWDAWADNGAADAAMRGVGDAAALDAVGTYGSALALRRGGRAKRAAGGGGLGLYGDVNAIDIPLEDDEVAKGVNMQAQGPASRPQSGGGGGGAKGKGMGSAVGSMAGAAIGSIIPGVGTMLGGLAGGLLGTAADNMNRGGRPRRAAGGPVDEFRSLVLRARNAIKSIESSGRYDAIGPPSKNGDRPWGAYQVMGSNIPAWTKKVTGTAMTPHQFLNSPEVQDTVFDNVFGSAMVQHGSPQDAASVWFSGRPVKVAGNDRDVLGTSVPDYVKKFNAHMGYETDTQPASSAMRALRAANDTEPEAGQSGVDSGSEPTNDADVDVDLTARTLNQLGLATGGRIHKDAGGALSPDEIDELINPRGLASPSPDEAAGAPQGLATAPPQPATPPPVAPPPAAAPPAAAPVPPPPAAPEPPQTGLAAAPPDQAAALGLQSTADARNSQPGGSPGFFDKGGWMDRNERPVMTGLTFLGNMLASPSRTLAGSVGTGLAAAAQAYPAMGFKQQGIDISKQQADTQQLEKIMAALNLVSRQKANFVGSNPQASTEQFDKNLSALTGRMYDLLGTKGTGATPSQGSATDYFKTLPPAAQAFIAQARPQDVPWYWQYMANTSLDPGERSRYEQQRDQATERMRMGQAISLDGMKTIPVDKLTQSAMGLRTAEASAVGTGSQMNPAAQLDALERQSVAILGKFSHPRELPPEKRAQYEEIQRKMGTIRQSIGPVTARKHGGRIAKQGGGPLDPAMSSSADEPPPITDQNDPQFWRNRAEAAAERGNAQGQSTAMERAQQLEQERRSSGVLTDPKGVVQNVPGSKEAAAEKKWQMDVTDRNQKVADEVYARAQDGRTSKQLVQSLRNTLFDKEGKAVTSTGPYGQALGKMGSTLTQLGVDPGLVQSVVSDPSKVEEANKLAYAIAGSIKSSSYPGAGQESFLRAIETATPGVNMLPEAIKAMLGLMEKRADVEIGLPKALEGVSPTKDYRGAVLEHLSKPENLWYIQAQEPKAQAKPSAPKLGEVPSALSGIKDIQQSQSTGQWYDPTTRNVYAADGTLIGKKP